MAATPGPDTMGKRFSFSAIAKTANAFLGKSRNVADSINLESLKSVTTNVSENVTNIASSVNMENLTTNLASMQNRVSEMASTASMESIRKVQGMATMENLNAATAAATGGLQTTMSGLEGLSKTIMDNIAEQKKALTCEEALKAKGNYQLLATIKKIEYQILLILFYFLIAFLINWYFVSGVEQTVNLMKNSRDFLNDPNLEMKLKESFGDLKKYGDLNQLKEGIGSLKNGIAQTIQDGAKKLQDGAKKLQDGAASVRDNVLQRTGNEEL